MSVEDAMAAMRAGEVPACLGVEGALPFYQPENTPPPRALPTQELVAEYIAIHDASLLTRWPRVVRCQQLYLWRFQHDFPPDVVLEITLPTDWRESGACELFLHDCPRITRFPGLHYDWLHGLGVTGCPLLEALPADLFVTNLTVRGCPRLRSLPDVLHATRVTLSDCPELTALPSECVVTEALDLAGCDNLTRLPDVLEALQLNITNCRGLTTLPSRLHSLYITMDGCTGLTGWDDPDVTELRQLSARACTSLASLPPNLRQIDELDVRGCTRLSRLPDELRVMRWIDVGDSGVKALPASAQGTQVRWNGVNVTGQVAFYPETLTARQALSEENAELRRVMLERIGPERFVREARPKQLDADTDVGGARRLHSVDMAGDEPLVALEVRDPSTGRVYLLRVPPEMTTCRQATAWIAGFDDPDDYRPLLET